MATHQRPFPVTFDRFDAGCLPVLLRRGIAEVEEWLRREVGTIEQVGNAKKYLAQMRSCLIDIERAGG